MKVIRSSVVGVFSGRYFYFVKFVSRIDFLFVHHFDMFPIFFPGEFFSRSRVCKVLINDKQK